MATSCPVVHTNDGSFIPASQRPDGSWRKQRRVKDGYVPQDEVPIYQSKGKQWTESKPQNYIPGLPISVQEKQEPGKKSKKKKDGADKAGCGQSAGGVLSSPALTDVPDETTERWETVKSRSGSKSTAAAGNSTSHTPANKKEGGGSRKEPRATPSTAAPPPQPPTPAAAAEPLKRLRNLKKKLKEITALEEKIKSKELKNPDKDQLSKVSRKGEIEEAILALEFEISLDVSAH